MSNINLPNRPDILKVVVLYDDGTQEVLTQKPLGSGKPSRCLFFDDFEVDGCTVKLRLDWGDQDHNNDPTLDADVSKDGKKLPNDPNWHHTPKMFDGNAWVYAWSFRGRTITFKVQLTRQIEIRGTATLALAPNHGQS